MRRETILGVVVAVALLAAPAIAWQPPEHPARKAEAARAARVALHREAAGLGWAPEPTPLRYDVVAYDLDLVFDFDHERIAGVVSLSATSLEDGLQVIRLDADAGLRIQSVWLEEESSHPDVPPRRLSHTREGDRLVVDLGRPFLAGEAFRLAVAYAGRASRLGDGVTWTILGGTTPSATTMAEPFGARVWVPCQDRPDDKAPWTLRITAPASLRVAANGVMVGRTENPGGTATTVWASRYPIATYLVAVNISDYRVVRDVYTGLDGTAAMPVETWAYPWNVELARRQFADTPALLGLLASHFGEYPFLDEKYGNCLAPIWAAGMEHQTLSSVDGGSGPDDNGILESESVRFLDVHEAAHQWWGDWVSPATWKDLWLNEGLATYSELLLAESEGNLARYLEDADWKGWFAGPLYDNPEPFSVTVYDKGARVLRMLEQLLGRRTFESALGVWRSRFGGGSATTEDFRAVLEEASGMDLEWFFRQWVYGSGRPHIRWSWKTEEGPVVRLDLEQVQTDTGLFRFPLDVRVTTVAGSGVHRVMVEAEPAQTIRIPLEDRPLEVSLDPGDWLLDETHAAGEPDLDLGPGFPGGTEFPPTVVGEDSTLTLEVGNVGGSDLHVTGARVYSSPAFSVELPPEGLTVPPGGKKSLDLHFEPPWVGSHRGWIALESDDPAGDGLTWILVEGTGSRRQGEALEVDEVPEWKEGVPVGSASERLLSVSGVGTSDLLLTARVEGEGFSLAGVESAGIAPGDTALFLVRFAPVREGPHQGLVVVETDRGARVSVPLEAEGVGAPRIEVEPGVVLFDSVAAGSTSSAVVRVGNIGKEPLRVEAVTASAPFSVRHPSGAPLEIAPGAAETLEVSVRGEVAGVLAGELRLLSDDPETPLLRIPLRARVRDSGTGTRVLEPAERVVHSGR